MVLKKIYAEIPDDIEKDFEKLINLFSLKCGTKSEMLGKIVVAGLIKILENNNSSRSKEIKEKMKKSIGML